MPNEIQFKSRSVGCSWAPKPYQLPILKAALEGRSLVIMKPQRLGQRMCDEIAADILTGLGAHTRIIQPKPMARGATKS